MLSYYKKGIFFNEVTTIVYTIIRCFYVHNGIIWYNIINIFFNEKIMEWHGGFTAERKYESGSYS